MILRLFAIVLETCLAFQTDLTLQFWSSREETRDRLSGAVYLLNTSKVIFFLT